MGPISLRDALAQSINVPAVKVLYIASVAECDSVGEKDGYYLVAAGLESLWIEFGAWWCGGYAVGDGAGVYGVFSNEGVLGAVCVEVW